MLLRAQFRRLVAQQLVLANTLATTSVFENRALPTTLDKLPMLTLTTPREVKETMAQRVATKFTTVIDLRIDARVAGDTDETTAATLERLIEEVELVVLANSCIRNVIQQWRHVETRTEIDMTGRQPVGTAVMMLQAELPQFYDPATPDVLARIQLTDTAIAGDPGLLDFSVPAAS